MNPKVDWYFAKHTKWKKEIAELRKIVLSAKLTEELKWGCPCYTLDNDKGAVKNSDKNNIVLIHVFKEYCALLFFKGVLLTDKKGILIQQTKYVQAARQIRFTNLSEIVKMKATIKAYIAEAIKVEKSGVKVKMKKTAQFPVAPEFAHELERNPRLKEAFYALTPGRQRGYLLYFASAKQSKTRTERVAKSMDKIFDGMGLDD